MARLSVREVYQNGKSVLSEAGLDSPAFDALLLLERAFGIGSRAALAIHGGEPAGDAQTALFRELIARRTREPLQYILGRWEFDGMPLHVGRGVLVPREDTLTLVECAAPRMAGLPAPRALDLCAGSGAVGLAFARRLPHARVLCVEKSPDALPYLRRNLHEFGQGRVDCAQADVLLPPPFDGEFDCLLANPPYIPRADIDSLAWEVRCEPRMALDGGPDGLDFYRAICALWVPLLRPGGLVAFEAGFDTGGGVAAIMRECGLQHIGVQKDFGGIDRCIFGTVVA